MPGPKFDRFQRDQPTLPPHPLGALAPENSPPRVMDMVVHPLTGRCPPPPSRRGVPRLRPRDDAQGGPSRLREGDLLLEGVHPSSYVWTHRRQRPLPQTEGPPRCSSNHPRDPCVRGQWGSRGQSRCSPCAKFPTQGPLPRSRSCIRCGCCACSRQSPRQTGCPHSPEA